jgi:hypothetical protein
MEKILVGLDIAFGLVKAGSEIYNLLKGKTDLSDDDLKDLIDKQNEAQATARQKLEDLLNT